MTTVQVSNPTRIGYFDYNDLATQSTPLALVANVYKKLTNDTLGPATNRLYPPPGVTDIWTGGATNQFTWAQLRRHDLVDFRIDLSFTSTMANQTFEVAMDMAIGSGGPYTLNFLYNEFKSSGTYAIVFSTGVYMGDLNTLNNPAELKVRSDAAGTLKVNGWYCKVIKTGGG